MDRLWLEDYRRFLGCVCRQHEVDAWQLGEIAMAACSSCCGFWVGCAATLLAWLFGGRPVRCEALLGWVGWLLGACFVGEQLCWRVFDVSIPIDSAVGRYLWGVIAGATLAIPLACGAGRRIWRERQETPRWRVRSAVTLYLGVAIVVSASAVGWGKWGAPFAHGGATIGVLLGTFFGTASLLRLLVLKQTPLRDLFVSAAVVGAILLYLIHGLNSVLP